MASRGEGRYECDKCGSVVPRADAVQLKRGHAVAKTLCSPCLETVGVPPGYELVRQLG